MPRKGNITRESNQICRMKCELPIAPSKNLSFVKNDAKRWQTSGYYSHLFKRFYMLSEDGYLIP